jgi:hypothetical protein
VAASLQWDGWVVVPTASQTSQWWVGSGGKYPDESYLQKESTSAIWLHKFNLREEVQIGVKITENRKPGFEVQI